MEKKIDLLDINTFPQAKHVSVERKELERLREFESDIKTSFLIFKTSIVAIGLVLLGFIISRISM